MEISIRELETWLDKHKDDIPERPKWKRTIMDIMGCTKLENRWSDLYKFFFLEKEEHGLKDLFIRSLEEVLLEHNILGIDGFAKGWMQKFCILREDPTKDLNGDDSKGRIDLLILGEDKKAIIIENKVFHTLGCNPLEQYEKTVKRKGWDSVIKIVLALNENFYDKEIAKEHNYIFITHSILVNKVLKNLPNYISDANPVYKPILDDFIQNILNVTNMAATNDELLFFYKEFEYLSRLQKLYSGIIREYKTSLNRIDFKGLKNPSYKSIKDDDNNQLVYLQFENCPRLFLTIILNYLWNKEDHKDPFVRIVLEIHPASVSKSMLDEIKTEIEKLKNKRPRVFFSNLIDEKNQSWRHLAYVDIDVKSKDNEPYIRPEDLAARIKETNLPESLVYKLGLKIIALINKE